MWSLCFWSALGCALSLTSLSPKKHYACSKRQASLRSLIRVSFFFYESFPSWSSANVQVLIRYGSTSPPVGRLSQPDMNIFSCYSMDQISLLLFHSSPTHPFIPSSTYPPVHSSTRPFITSLIVQGQSFRSSESSATRCTGRRLFWIY